MTWLSYLYPITLYRGKTARGTKLEIRELWGERKLDMDGYPQSGRVYRQLWKRILARIGAVNLPQRAQVLLLGLGGGDVIRVLRANFKMTVVELEPEVVEVAQKYFGITKSPSCSIIIQNAKTFVEKCQSKFELIIVDLYSGDGIPKFVDERKFWKNLCRMLKPRGVVVVNYASHSFREKDFASFTQKLQRVFTQVEMMKIAGHTFYRVALS